MYRPRAAARALCRGCSRPLGARRHAATSSAAAVSTPERIAPIVGARRHAATSSAAAVATPERIAPIAGLDQPHTHHGAVGEASAHPRAPSVELSPPLTGAVTRVGSSGALPSERYAALVESGVLAADGAQLEVVRRLDALCNELRAHQGAMQAYVGEFGVWHAQRLAAEAAEHKRRAAEAPTHLSLLRGRTQTHPTPSTAQRLM